VALIYRALWQDDQSDLTRTVRDRFVEWIREKFGDVAVEGMGQTKLQVNGDVIEVSIQEAIGEVGANAMMEVIRATLVETRNDGGSRWETKVRAWKTTTDDQPWATHGWVWVDVLTVGEDIEPRLLSPAAPRIVRNLLPRSGSAHINGIPLDTDVLRYFGESEGEALAEFISTMERKQPTVVFVDSGDSAKYLPNPSLYTFEDIVDRARQQVAGIGRVAVVDSAAAAAFTEALGKSHGVWGDAFRIYMRDVDPAIPGDAIRHPYVAATRYMRDLGAAAHLIGRALSPISAIQRPPKEYDTAKEILDHSLAGDDYAALFRLATQEADSAKQEVLDLRQQVNAMTNLIEGQAIDGEIMTETINQLRNDTDVLSRHVQYLRERLGKVSVADRFAESALAYVTIPTAAESTSQAVGMARQYLHGYLSIPDDAVDADDLGKMDSTNASGAIAANAWHGFRALHAYAQAMAEPRARGDSFWTWCEKSDHPWKWRATPTSLAMRESETIKNRPECRTFPVSTTVSASGRIYMDKHLKFDTNGELAPRIYFHFDPSEPRVHVGFFGPHTRLKNSTT
jgi:hypothetical protein